MNNLTNCLGAYEGVLEDVIPISFPSSLTLNQPADCRFQEALDPSL